MIDTRYLLYYKGKLNVVGRRNKQPRILRAISILRTKGTESIAMEIFASNILLLAVSNLLSTPTLCAVNFYSNKSYQYLKGKHFRIATLDVNFFMVCVKQKPTNINKFAFNR